MRLPMNIRCKHFPNKTKDIELTLKERGLMKYLVGTCISQDGVVSKIECIPIDCPEIRFKVALNRSKQTTLSCFYDAVLKIVSDEDFNNYQGNTEIIVNAQFKVQEKQEPQCKQPLEKKQDEGNKGNKNEFQSILPLEITSGLNDKEDIVQNSAIPAQKPPPVPKKPKSVKNNIPVKPPVKAKPKKIDKRTVAHQKPSEHEGPKPSKKPTEHNELTPSEHEGPKPSKKPTEHNNHTPSGHNDPKPSEHDDHKPSQKSSEPYDSTGNPSEHNIPKSSKEDVHTGTPENKYCKPFVKSTEEIDLYAGTPFELESQIASVKPSEQIEPFDPAQSKLKDPTHSELKNLILPEPTDCPLFQYCVEGKVFDNYVTTWPQPEYDVPAKRHIYENEKENSDEGSGDEYEDMSHGFWPQPKDVVFLEASEPVPSELPLRNEELTECPLKNEELTELPEEKEPSGFISYLTVSENEKKVKPSLGDKVKHLFRRSRHRIRSKADIPDDLSNMTCQDVQDCLNLLKLEKHVEKFRENGIDGRLLMDLDQKMMEELDLTLIDIHKLQLFTESKWLPNV
ncbi:uncharacterized protein [Antedon mediterranea]|uniref:uncharacterized protein n=1 Tax=Antedon mediterranea TaxID=105859 RepID=UPI003AF5122A